MRTLTLAYCTLSLARIMAMDSIDSNEDIELYSLPVLFNSVEWYDNRNIGLSDQIEEPQKIISHSDVPSTEQPLVTHSTQSEQKTAARKVKDLLLKGALPKDLFIQCVEQHYKLPSLKQIGTLLKLQILHKKISQADFEQFARHHKHYVWRPDIDENIKHYIQSWCTRSYASIKSRPTHSAHSPSSRQIIRVSKTGLPLRKNTPEELFKKGGVQTCKKLIREKNYCPSIFNIIWEKKSRIGNKPLKAETMISFAGLVQKNFTLEQLKAIDEHLKKHPLPEDINSHVLTLVQAPLIAHKASINQEVTL